MLLRNEVTRGPPEVAFSQILGNLGVTSLKRLSELYIIILALYEARSVRYKVPSS